MKSMTTREKYKKTDKGITLIALVVTIIVLLILAGVSIAMLTGQNGILRRAEEAGTNTAHAEVYEILNLQTVDYITESKLGEYSGSLIEYLSDKGYIETMDGIEGYIIKVEALLGQKGKYGNGTDGMTDVYKLEEVLPDTSKIEKVATKEVVKIAANTNKKYKVVYYGKNKTEIITMGYLQDNGINNGKELIKFGIGDSELTAEMGMTWEEWINSKYCEQVKYSDEIYEVYIDEDDMVKLRKDGTYAYNIVIGSGSYSLVYKTEKIEEPKYYLKEI